MVNYFENILESAIKICNDEIICDESYYKGFLKIYPFTTENISGYIENFNLKDKSLLTVGSSGDQVFNAILNGCKKITIIDINPFTKYYYNLKAAGVIELSKEEFLRFFRYKDYPKVFKENKFVFDKEYYEQIKLTLKLLDYESYLFWDSILNIYNGEQVRNKLFMLDEDRTAVIEKINPYLENTSFETLKTKLKTVYPNFIIGNIFKENINCLYDNIWLSNIGTYISRNSVKIMVDKFSQLLTANGKLLISYLYETTENTKYQIDWCPIYDLKKTLGLLKEYKTKIITFPGVKGIKLKDENIKDSILVYKK